MDSVRHNHPDDASELLSAFVDGAVDIAERKRAESLIERCPACAREVGELRALKSMLRELPAARPVRSFTLDPATAPRPRRLLFPTLRLATVLSVMLLFVVLGVDALGGAVQPTSGGAAATGGAAASAAAMLDERTMTQAEEPQSDFGVMAASADAQAAEASAVPSVQAESYAQASAEASQAAGSQASAANAPAAAVPESRDADGSQATASTSPAPTVAAGDAASQAPAAVLVAPPAGAGEALSAGAEAERQTSSPDTATAAGEPAGQPGFDTLRLAQLLLALAAVGLGLGAFWAWRTGR